ncbi:hypothetical protein HDU86_007493 [Geranomyces michiganensis]|nr:hypothetical protein HDU86_007493 [Geranomyces michiganensis]
MKLSLSVASALALSAFAVNAAQVEERGFARPGAGADQGGFARPGTADEGGFARPGIEKRAGGPARPGLANVAQVAATFANINVAAPVGSVSSNKKSFGAAPAKATKKINPKAEYVPNTYMVEFDLAHKEEPKKTIKNFFGSNKTLKPRTSISTSLFKGQSFTVDSEHTLEDLLKIPGAKKVYPVRVVKRPTIKRTATKQVAAPADQDITSHKQTGVAAQHKAGNFGKGVKVAVVDTGVYWKHPALGGCFGKGCRISFGMDLVGDFYNLKAGNTTAVEDNDPMDNCSEEAHGTHTTGIIGADARKVSTPGFMPALPFTGVAPAADLGHYRVFGCGGDTSSDIIAKALYKGFEDGADIISMSIGSAGVVPTGEVDTVAVERVAKAGVHVVVSAGNDGSEGLFTTGSPSIAPAAYSVASWDIHAIMQPQIFDAAGKAYPYSPAAAHGGWKGDQQYQIVVADPADNCVAKPYPAAAGKVLMVHYSPTAGCGTSIMCGNAAKNNATGCLIYGLPGAAAGNAAISGAVLDAEHAPQVLDAVAKNPTAKWHFTDKQALFNSATGSTASSFSSYGTDIELNMKPDIASVGGNVYSTVSPHAAAVATSDQAYAYMSGTSMACPNFAGSLALFIEARGRLSIEKTKAYFQNNAQITNEFTSKLVENPVRSGGGFVNTTAAILANTIVTPSQLSLNDTKRIKSSYKINIKNGGKKTVTYTLTDIASGLVTGMEKGNDVPTPNVKYSEGSAKVSLDKKTVKVAAGKSVDITVKITPPKDNKLFPFYGGFIVATPSDGSAPVHVPYMGMVGDFSKTKVIAEQDPSGAVTGVYNADGEPIEEGATLNAKDGIIANLVLGQSTRIAFIDVISAGETLPGYTPSLGVLVTGNSGNAFNKNLARNVDSSAQGFVQGGYQYPWNGATTLSPSDNGILNLLPAGKYKLRFTALKHFGDASNPKDFDVYTSPAFNLVY